ncbi:DUF4397 domain-containing protein [Pedobacter sp. SAFR-022]|uniref:DUF4397 domain-containing protein n=1 Tax=Pedobacter sp. SAFR-022 TaxID=3436861 RepID=UPI003F818440
MKISTNLKSSFKMLFAALTLSAVITSCSKDFDNTPAPAVSGLNMINASPTTELLDFYVNNTRGNNENFGLGKKLGYYNLYSGTSKISITKKGSQTTLASENFNFAPERGYSLFVIGKVDSLKFLMVKDSVSMPASGKANVRFVNVSPDAPALNLAVGTAATDLVTDKAYKQYSEFTTIDAAPKVTFTAKNKATGAVEATLADVEIKSGATYTIWVKGLKAATDSTKLGLAIFTH